MNATTAPQDILSLHDVHVAYGNAQAIEGVSLRMRPGQIVSVIGPNGAGKSTLLNTVMGILPPYSRVDGRFVFNGADMSRSDVAARVGLGISLVPEKRELFGTMSVLDNLILGAIPRRASGQAGWMDQLDTVYDIFPRLRERREQMAATLSGGERQMLALGRALMSRPALLMLDEPSLGLAPRVCREIFAVVSALRSTGVSILLIEQNARAALQISDYAYVLEMGRLTLEGEAAEVAANERVIQAYLGVGRSTAAA
ncbi:ABC transporter ATP-binding protein [Variovorax boronicumulans]|uniref:ABC transporter ATP-binding protein n=1 Tax=Variovorax boronicumulans TaxID=436515 RepID=UPI001C59D252